MYPIVRREKLADKIYLMDVKAPRVAQYCEPGQFVIVYPEDPHAPVIGSGKIRKLIAKVKL